MADILVFRTNRQALRDGVVAAQEILVRREHRAMRYDDGPMRWEDVPDAWLPLLPWHAAISVDVDSSGIATPWTTGASLSYSITAGGGANALVAIAIVRRGGTISSVSFGGVSVTSTGTARTGTVVTLIIYYAVLGTLSSGSKTLSITSSATTWLAAGAIVLLGVDQGSPVDAQAGGAALSTSITTIAAGAAIVDCFGDHGNATTPTMGAQTNRLAVNRHEVDPPGNSDAFGCSRLVTKVAAGAQTMDWSMGGADLGPAVAAMSFTPAAGGGGGGRVHQRSSLEGLGGAGQQRFNPPLTYHRYPPISLEAYRRDRARAHRDFMEKVEKVEKVRGVA